MANSNGVISAPVSIDDVRSVLGQSSYDLGTLCKASTINGWSKKKPVKFNAMNHDNPNWYKAQDGFCGFTVGWSTSTDSSLTNLINAYRNGTWIYNKPTGGSSQPFRLLDFNGYNHKAKPFIYSGYKKGTVVEVNVMESNAATFWVTYNSDSTAVQISDFGSAAGGLTEAHLGAALYDRDPIQDTAARRLQTVISADKITNRGTVTFNFSSSDIGASRYVVFFLASPTVSNNICIPYSDDNHYMVRIYITQRFPLTVTPTLLGNSLTGFHDLSWYTSNNFKTNNGNADAIFFLRVVNETSTAMKIGNDSSVNYQLRMWFDSRYGIVLFPSDSYGTATGTKTIAAKSTYQGYFRATAPFKELVGTMTSTQTRTMVSIQAYNVIGGLQKVWMNVSSAYGVLISK